MPTELEDILRKALEEIGPHPDKLSEHLLLTLRLTNEQVFWLKTGAGFVFLYNDGK